MHQRRFHILVADEDQASLTVSVTTLKRRDYVVAGAATSDEAHWWLRGWPIDLVVSAARFGAQSGLQFILGARASQPEMAGLIIGIEEDMPDAVEARRHGLYVTPSPIDSDDFLARVGQCLASITRRQRWPRKEITSPFGIRVGTSVGKLMDVSYGGLKFELPEESCVLRSPVMIDFPRADLTLQADVVWSARRDDSRTCVFGAAIKDHPGTPTEWRALVDRLT